MLLGSFYLANIQCIKQSLVKDFHDLPFCQLLICDLIILPTLLTTTTFQTERIYSETQEIKMERVSRTALSSTLRQSDKLW